MAVSVSPLMPDQLIDRIATGREPTDEELFAQARHTWIDGAADRSVFTWNCLSDNASERVFALRGAKLALGGSSCRDCSARRNTQL